MLNRGFWIIPCLFICVSVSHTQNYPSRAIQSTLSIPIGAILPVGNTLVDKIFKMALKRHNAQVVVPFSPSNLGSQPALRFRVFLQTSIINDSFTMAQEFCNHISQRTHAIVGFWESSSMSTIVSYSDTFSVPWITPSLPLPDTPTKNVIFLHPKLEKFLLDLVYKLGWKQFTLVFDQQEEHLPVKATLAFALKWKIKVQVRNLAGDDNIFPTLKEIACRKEYKVLFDLKLTRSMQILEKIKVMGMLSMDYHYIFSDLFLIEQDLMKFGHGASNLTFFGLVEKSSDLYESVLQGQSNNEFESLGCDAALIYDAFSAMAMGMGQATSDGLVFNSELDDDYGGTERATCHQMPVISLNTGDDIGSAIKRVQFQGLSGNVEFDETGQRVNYGITIYTLDRLGVNSVGRWTDSSDGGGDLVMDEVDLVEQTGRILESYKNETLIVTTIVEEPYVVRKSNWRELVGNDRFEGFCVDLLKEIKKIVPIKYRIKPVQDGQYGSKNDKDGTWNGMIGEVKYQQAHMAVAPLTITSAREAVVDFTKPFMTLGISIMIKKPEKQTYNIFSFLDPLSAEIWICIVFAYIGVSVVLYLVSRFSPYEWHRKSLSRNEEKHDEVDAATDFGIFNSLWFSLGAFVQQGCDISPKSFSGRIVGGVWWLFTLIVISSYTANLAAFLTVDKMVSPIAGAEDLVKQNVIKYGTLKSGSTVNFFKQSPLPTYEKMWGAMKSQDPSVFVRSNKDGIARVRASNGKYAFLMESTLNDYIEQRRPCNTMKVGPNIDSKGYGIALPKGSPLYDTINLAILTLREQGKLQKLKNYWWYDKSECGSNGGGGATKTPALTLGNVAGVFYILIGGMVLAIFTAVMEFWYHAQKIRSLKKKQQKAKAAERNRLLVEVTDRQRNIPEHDSSVDGDRESSKLFKFKLRK